jgi:uncharacterized protein (DUF1499 family)
MGTRRKMWQPIVLGLVGAVVFYGLALVVVRLASPRPSLGISPEGKFRDCPNKPNCVCSQSTDPNHAIPPLRYSGDGTEALARLVELLSAQLPRCTLLTHERLHGYDYARFECRTLVLRYIDDLELVVDPTARVIHLRSASRLGYSDLGVNRRRVAEVVALAQRQLPQHFPASLS